MLIVCRFEWWAAVVEMMGVLAEMMRQKFQNRAWELLGLRDYYIGVLISGLLNSSW